MAILQAPSGIRQHRSLISRIVAGDDMLLVGIDVAKIRHVAAVQRARRPSAEKARPRSLPFANEMSGFERLGEVIEYERVGDAENVLDVVCGVEPTGRYHKPLCAWLERQGYHVVLISGVVAAANRKTLQGTTNHDDVSDSENLLDLMRQGKVLYYLSVDNDYAEIRIRVRTYRKQATALASCRAGLRTCLATSFPEVEELFDKDILHQDLLRMLSTYPTAHAVASEDIERFVSCCMLGRRKSQAAEERIRLAHELAANSIGYDHSPAFCREVFSLLEEIAFRKQQRERALQNLEDACRSFRAWARLQTIPGIGPNLAAIILSEIGDPHGYAGVGQVIRLAGLNLCQAHSGKATNGPQFISHAGKAELRRALYIATTIAVRKDDVFRDRYWDALSARGGPGRKGAKKRSLVKLMAKMLRTAFAVMRDDVPYDPALIAEVST